MVHQPADWPALRRLSGDPRLDEPRFADVAARRTKARALADILEASLGHLTRRELQQRAMEMRLPLGSILDLAELRRDPQVLARDFLAEVAFGTGAPVCVPRLPLLWNGDAFPVGPVPASIADGMDIAS